MYKIYAKQFVLPPGRAKQLLRVMKLTTLIMLIAFLHVSASTMAQKVSLNVINAPLVTVFNQIKKQTGYDFAFTGKTLDQAKSVTINVKNKELADVLKQIFDDQPLDYKIDDKSIEISRKDPSFLDNFKDKVAKLLTLPANITGRVVDSLGNPLEGASVSLKNTNYNTLTDNKGNFTLSSVPEGKYTLVITYIGYAKIERSIEEQSALLNLFLVMHASSSALDQIQIIGYGTESKRYSVGNVATVTAEQIEKQPVTNPLLALEGLVPGLAVTSTSGVPGSTTLVQLRGQNTLATNINLKPYDQPYFIVDGVPYATQNTNVNQFLSLAFAPYSGGISQAGGISPFNDINPNDIESITILKDADATAIYGSKGANGVILITTKKGKAGKTSFDLNINSQFNEAAKPVQLLNTQQYLQLRKQAFAQDGITPTSDPNDFFGYAPDLTIYDQNKYTNWQKVIQGANTNNTDVHASVSGGGPNGTFIISGGYTRSDYNYPGDFADQRYTLHTGIHTNSTDKKFRLDLVADYAYDHNNSAGFGGSGDVTLPPNSPDMVDKSGNLIWNYKGVDLNTDNFYSYLKQPDDLQTFSFNSSLNLNYEIIKGLKVGLGVGYSRNTGTEHSIDPLSSQEPSQYGNTISAQFGNTSAQDINIEPQINYNTTIGKGVLSALLGGTYENNTTSSFADEASGYANDNFLNSVNGAATQYGSDTQNPVKYTAFFGRLKYIYDQKYILEVSGRRDGSSNFGPGYQFGNFGSVGTGWIFSEEKVFKDAFPFMSYGKLSGSYGTTGSDASMAYQYQALYQSALGATSAFEGVIRQSYPYNLYNPDFRWATKKSINVGLDLGFFNSRLLFNATYYRDREGDQLVSYPLAAQAGFSTVYENQNALVQNKGWEFTLTSTNVKSKDFIWTTNFNLSFNRNKLLAFPNLASSSYASQYVIGQPTSVIFGYRYKDVNPTTGQFEFYSANGTVTSTPNYLPVAQGGDQVIIGNREIKYMGGFGNTFTYKSSAFMFFASLAAATNLMHFTHFMPIALWAERVIYLPMY
jgi:TonB-linked SusC/RagA family outer membrane protein